ncbi:hypothetical protein BN1058_00543 [Paraliobacillus sp. PM-2]|uniref:hypothetical protein n=1 Tax=Paraliobacillus sp. PM-2 TaxID=1462524 RepID=UPI00061C1E03|nr:hypothetical protein [Paraliobacillus sp. PM-2]CQR46290.1 hypothetical protein BN1058_00543 [Paraliobacillus sp. PM-2]
MKVNKLIIQLEKTIGILKCYENWKIEDMLDDIKEKVSAQKPNPLDQPKKTSPEIEISVPIDKMKTMNRQEITKALKKYKKAELIAIGKQLKLKLTMNNNKAILIESIANHFSYLQLNDKMANR